MNANILPSTAKRMSPFVCASVAAVYASYPPAIGKKLMLIRQLIFELAAATDGVGEMTETLKWGEPAYLTTQSNSGSTIRLGWKKAKPNEYAIYFHCQTKLIESFRTIFPKIFRYEGNRAIVFLLDDEICLSELNVCLIAALTYHQHK